MNLSIDLEKMKEVYGEEIIEIISENMDIIEENIRTLKEMNFNDIPGIFEGCPSVFMNFPKRFKEKMEKLVEEIGDDYVDVIQNDVSILEKM